MDLITADIHLEDQYGDYFAETVSLPAIPRNGDRMQLCKTDYAYHEVLRVRWDISDETYVPIIIVKK